MLMNRAPFENGGRIDKGVDTVKVSLSIRVALEISDGEPVDLLKAGARTPSIP